jgi:hypothetical protein
VDYTITLNGEYPPRHPFGPYAGGDDWGEWDHIFTAEWHQGSWAVSYGGVSIAAYCIQVNNSRHPDAGGGNPTPARRSKGSEITSSGGGAVRRSLRAMAVSMMHFYQSPNERRCRWRAARINGNAAFDGRHVHKASYASVPGMDADGRRGEVRVLRSASRSRTCRWVSSAARWIVVVAAIGRVLTRDGR